MTPHRPHNAWDEILEDIEQRTEQIRQMKAFEPKRMIIQGLTAAAALLAAGGVVGGVLVNLLQRG